MTVEAKSSQHIVKNIVGGKKESNLNAIYLNETKQVKKQNLLSSQVSIEMQDTLITHETDYHLKSWNIKLEIVPHQSLPSSLPILPSYSELVKGHQLSQ